MRIAASLLSLSIICMSSLAQAGPDARYLVVFKSDTLPATATKTVTANGGKVTRTFQQIGVISAVGNDAFAAKVARDASVLAVGPDKLNRQPQPAFKPYRGPFSVPQGAPTPVDDLYGLQWDLRRIGAPAVWSRLPLAPQRPKVAVIDTGVMDDHPDLVGQVCTTKATSYCNTSGGSGNTASYPIYSTLIDFDAHPVWTPADGCTPAPTYYVAHGTHVAGTIAAKFGGAAVVGVAPDACVGAYKVFDRIRVTDPVEGLIDDVAAFDGPVFAAVIDAVVSGYPVISMSLGRIVFRNDKDDNASWLAWNRVARFADNNGVLLVAAAGNDATSNNGNIAFIPSDVPTILSVSATGTSQLLDSPAGLVAAPGSDVLAFYSNYGAAVDMSAPGGDCGPTFPAGCEFPYFILNTYIFETDADYGAPGGAGQPGYAWFAGTSMATPHVSAVAAYVRTLHPGWTTGALRAHLKSHAQNIGSRQLFGAGMVDADSSTR